MRRLGRILCAIGIHWPVSILNFSYDKIVRIDDNRALRATPFWQCMCGQRKKLLQIPETPKRSKGDGNGN